MLNINPEFPVGNAAGWCKSVDEVRKVAESAAQFIVVGSITEDERAGNPGNTFNGDLNSSLNSLGLPNPGIEKIRQMAPEMIRIAHEAKKPIFLSIAASEPAIYGQLTKVAQELGFDGVEVNIGCPNKFDGGKRTAIASFDPKIADEILMEVFSVVTMKDPNWFISVKVSPMSNPQQIIDMAEVISGYPTSAIVTQNTFPNGLLFNENGTTQIQTPDKNGWAGLAGATVKAMALGQVNQWRRALNALKFENIQVWGVGGVQNGADVRDMLRAGASVVQVGTAYFVGGPKVFGDIAGQFI